MKEDWHYKGCYFGYHLVCEGGYVWVENGMRKISWPLRGGGINMYARQIDCIRYTAIFVNSLKRISTLLLCIFISCKHVLEDHCGNSLDLDTVLFHRNFSFELSFKLWPTMLWNSLKWQSKFLGLKISLAEESLGLQVLHFRYFYIILGWVLELQCIM